MSEKSVILIVDDNKTIHKFLAGMLTKANYQVIEAFEAAEGLRLAKDEQPDLILLDVMIPGMDGFEMIRWLKSDSATADIPVIFLSARVQTENKVKGLEMGAADYLSKPVDRAELTARIRTHIKLKHQEEALREYTQNLEKMVEERTKQLIHSDRLASLGTLAAGIVHEINNPTTFISGNLQTMETFWGKIVPYLKNHPQAKDDPKIEYILKEYPAMIESVRKGADRITGIVAGLKTFSRKDTTHKSPTDVNECIEEALNLTHNRLKYYVRVEKNLDPNLPRVWADSQQLIQVFVNLMINASDAIGENQGRLRITSRSTANGRMELSFVDNGQGMSPEVKDKIFNPFFTTKSAGEGTGLGLSITHGIIRDHEGTIEVNSEPDQGTTFVLTLPTEKIQ